MNKRAIGFLAVVVAIAGIAAWFVAPQLTHHEARDDSPQTSGAPKTDERKILYWYDPMVPQSHFDKPGKSPFMDMQLVPKYADEGDAGTVTIDPRVVQNLGVRTAKVERGAISQRVDTVGVVQADERRIEVVQTRAAGWVERLYVRAVNDSVRRGQLLAEIYAPDLHAAQQEFVLARKMAEQRAQDSTLLDASRARLSSLGLGEAQIRALEKGGEPQRRVSYVAPRDGVVTELGVREGTQVSPGMTLFSLVDLAKVWITAEIPEERAALLAVGGAVETSVAALPGQSFKGRIDYVYPDVTAETRTLKARIEVENPKLELKPGMYASVALLGESREGVLMVPSEAVIHTGQRSIVIVDESGGRFRPVAVTTGAEAGGRTEILSGVDEGQAVVASGQFLIDSEANLRGGLERLEGSSP